MTEELYVNKNGFKCVMSQLAKTDGRDPQEHGQLVQRHAGDKQAFAQELKTLKVRAAKFAEE